MGVRVVGSGWGDDGEDGREGFGEATRQEECRCLSVDFGDLGGSLPRRGGVEGGYRRREELGGGECLPCWSEGRRDGAVGSHGGW